MKSKQILILSIFQLIIGILAIAAFAVVGLSGESMAKWMITFILAAAFVALGVVGIMDYKSNK